MSLILSPFLAIVLALRARRQVPRVSRMERLRRVARVWGRQSNRSNP